VAGWGVWEGGSAPHQVGGEWVSRPPTLVIRRLHVLGHDVKAHSRVVAKMAHERTRFITIRLDPPISRGSGSTVTSDGSDDDLAAVLRWLGEASAAGWRVTAHIPQAQMALVVTADVDDIDSDSGTFRQFEAPFRADRAG
jgi:hypothetical protein